MDINQPIRFINRDKTQFYKELKSRVDAFFNEKGISKHANSKMVLKTIILLSVYLVPFGVILFIQPPFAVSLIFWVIMGLAIAGIGMSIMHDANHGSYSKNKTVNHLMGLTLNMLGGSIFNWKLQHNLLHHTYTNIAGWDEDIKDKFGLKFTPHYETKNIHRFQWLYAFVLYSIVTLYWATMKDILQFIRYTKAGVNQGTKKENIIIFTKIVISKLGYFFVMVFVPIVFFNLPFWQVITGFLLMHILAGIILTTTFQLAHTVEGTTHPMPNDKGNIENEWAIHQLNTTANFARSNTWISWYVGGLNFQIEHHLFPNICHVHYPDIAPIVKQTAEEYGLEYIENKSLGKAISSHVQLLKRFGNNFNLNEAIG